MQGNNPTNPLSYDYSPCTFSNLEVVCDQVLLEEVKKVFYMASDLRFLSIQLILQPFVFTETYIPEDVLGNKRVLEIMLQYPPGANKNSSLTLQVDPNAFRSTKNYTRKVTLNNFDCNLLAHKKFVDVSLVFEDQLVTAHCIILIAFSPYFEVRSNPINNPIIQSYA